MKKVTIELTDEQVKVLLDADEADDLTDYYLDIKDEVIAAVVEKIK